MAEFFNRIRAGLIYSVCCVIFTFCLGYGVYLNGAKRVTSEHTFYFLVSKNMHVETSAHLSKWQGGAGYVLERNEKLFVVHSVYTDESSANTALNSNADVDLLTETGGELYFIGAKEKKGQKSALLALETLYNAIKLVNETSVRLDNGLTQEKAKGLLNDVALLLKGAARSYQESFFTVAELCNEGAAMLSKACEEVVFSKDLRYAACFLSDGYLSFCEQFRL